MWLAFRGLRRRWRRTALTVLGSALGTTSYLVLVASAGGLVRELNATISVLGSEVTIQRAGAAHPLQSRLDEAELAAVRGVPGVAAVRGVVIGATRLPGGRQFYVAGLDPTPELVKSVRIMSGRALEIGAGEMMVGVHAAQRLDLAPGMRIELMQRTEFEVVGIYETGRSLLDNAAVVDLHAAQQTFRQSGLVNLAFVKLAPGTSLKAAVSAIERAVPRVEAGASDVYVASYRQLAVAEAFAQVLALLAVAIAGLGVANTMAMSVTERTQELGILRAVGWTRARIGRLIALETALLTAGGFLVGVPLAAAALAALGRVDQVGVVPQTLPARAIIEAAAVAVASAALGAVPALARALRLQPARALRTIT